MATPYTICCKKDTGFILTISDDNKVVFAPAKENDENQLWYKKTPTGSSSFAVVHKSRELALMYPRNVEKSKFVELTPYDSSNKNILWNESETDKEGFKIIKSPEGGDYPNWFAENDVVKDGNRLQVASVASYHWKMTPA